LLSCITFRAVCLPWSLLPVSPLPSYLLLPQLSCVRLLAFALSP
jgi:hypothetical protein